MAKPSHDVVVKVGEWTDREGKVKAKYKNIGAVYSHSDGGMYLAIDATVLTMGMNYLANRDRSDRVLMNLFERREDGERGRPEGKRQQDRPREESKAGAPQLPKDDDFDDDIPF